MKSFILITKQCTHVVVVVVFVFMDVFQDDCLDFRELPKLEGPDLSD